MAKIMMIALAVVALAQLASAKFESSCNGVKQIPLASMEKEDNMCHFLVMEDGVEQRDSSSLEAYDRVHICACNLWNKGYIWANLNNKVVRKLNEVIDHRLYIMGLGDFTGKRNLLDFPKETLQSKLLYLDDEYKTLFKDELPSDEIKKGCMNMLAEFNRFNKFFANLNAYTGSTDITQSIVSSNKDLKQMVRVFRVCKKADFRE